MNTVAIDTMVRRWSDPAARPLFRGCLIDEEGVCCAQGDVLRVCGWDDYRLHLVDQHTADKAVAAALGISLTHAVLLRLVNDTEDGCPQDVLAHPEKILGDQAPRILEFWRRLDQMPPAAMDAAVAKAPTGDEAWTAGDEAWTAAGQEAQTAARAAARAANWAADRAETWPAARIATPWAVAMATAEIQGAAGLTAFYFLPLFGINDPSQLDGT